MLQYVSLGCSHNMASSVGGGKWSGNAGGSVSFPTQKSGDFPPTGWRAEKNLNGHSPRKSEFLSSFPVAVWLCISHSPSLSLSGFCSNMRLILSRSYREDWMRSHAQSPSMLVWGGTWWASSPTSCYYQAVIVLSILRALSTVQGRQTPWHSCHQKSWPSLPLAGWALHREDFIPCHQPEWGII